MLNDKATLAASLWFIINKFSVLLYFIARFGLEGILKIIEV